MENVCMYIYLNGGRGRGEAGCVNSECDSFPHPQKSAEDEEEKKMCARVSGAFSAKFSVRNPADDDGDGQLGLFLSWVCSGDPKQKRNILIEFYCGVSFSLYGIFHYFLSKHFANFENEYIFDSMFFIVPFA